MKALCCCVLWAVFLTMPPYLRCAKRFPLMFHWQKKNPAVLDQQVLRGIVLLQGAGMLCRHQSTMAISCSKVTS